VRNLSLKTQHKNLHLILWCTLRSKCRCRAEKWWSTENWWPAVGTRAAC